MNKPIFTFKKFSAVIILLTAQNAFAANFSITPVGALPTLITPGQTVTATYNITNLTSMTRYGYSIQGLPAGKVTQNTTAPNCPSSITLAPNASCQLQLDITAPVSSSFALCKQTSCTTASASLNVLGPKTPRFAYVTQYEATQGVLVCKVNPSNGSLSNCTDVGAHNVLDNIFPQDIAINKAGTVAYLTAYNDLPFAYQCNINTSNGTFSSCSSTNITSPTNYDTVYGFLTLNASGTTAFVANSDGSPAILACPIINNAFTSTCTDTGATTLGSSPNQIVLNQANTIAYIGNYYTNYVTQCNVSGTSFSGCTSKTGDGNINFSSPAGVALTPTGNLLYVTDYNNNTVYYCNPTPNGPNEFSSCLIATDSINNPWGITINQQGTYAYVTDYDNTVSVCAILGNGSFSCTPTQTSFSDPVSVALLY